MTKLKRTGYGEYERRWCRCVSPLRCRV